MTTLDLQALGQVLNQRRHQRQLSVADVAAQLDATPEEVAALEAGEEPRLRVAVAALSWLDLDIEGFLIDPGPGASVDPVVEARSVAAFLRSDRDLKPESAEAIEAVLQAAYARFSAA